MELRPTVEEVIAIHREEVGPGVELRDRARLEAALEAPWQSAGLVDAYPSLHEKAAVLYFGIDRGQPFVDGNKRTAMLTVRLFYAYHGLDFVAPMLDGYAVAEYVATTKDPDLSIVADRFAEWCTPVDPPPDDDY